MQSAYSQASPLGGSYSSAEMLSTYCTALAYWAGYFSDIPSIYIYIYIYIYTRYVWKIASPVSWSCTIRRLNLSLSLSLSIYIYIYISSHSCCMYVRAGCSAFAWPYAGVHRSRSLMCSFLLLQQCPACLVRLTWIVFVMGGRWPYSC